jgi:hypothetical protein
VEKSKAKTEDLLALLNSGFHREKEVDMWRATAGDPYPIETPTKIGSQNGSTSPTTTRSCRSPEGSSRSTGPGGTPSQRCRREAGLRAEHVAFSFMKRRVELLMARDTLGYQHSGDEDTSRMPGD